MLHGWLILAKGSGSLMKDDNQKVSAFAEAVGLEIDHKIHEIEREIEQYREKTIEKTYEQTYDRMFDVMQTRVREIKQQQRRQVTQAHLQQRRKLILQRNKLSNQLFADLRLKLEEFTASPAYAVFLQEDITRACEDHFSYEQIVVRLRPQDFAFAEQIQAHLTAHWAGKGGTPPKTIEITTDSAIQLGGFILWNPLRQVLLDMTLEAKLAEQEQRFRQMPDFRLAFAESVV